MISSQIYILISIIVLFLVFFIRKNNKSEKLTPLAGLSFAFILAGIIFGEDGITRYSFLGIGVLFAAIDIIRKLKK